MPDVAAELRRARERLGLTPAAAARRLGVRRQHYWRWETSGRRPRRPLAELLRMMEGDDA